MTCPCVKQMGAPPFLFLASYLIGSCSQHHRAMSSTSARLAKGENVIALVESTIRQVVFMMACF